MTLATSVGGFNVWFQSFANEYAYLIGEINQDSLWSVAPQADKGDLLLAYRTMPQAFVRDVFVLNDQAKRVKAEWKVGLDHMAPIRRVCTLGNPIHWGYLKTHPEFKDSQFVRMQMQGRIRATDYWPELYEVITSRNRDCEHALRNFSPAKIRQF